MGDNIDQAVDSQTFPTKTMSTVQKRWESQDLELLRSGLFADAEVSCFGGRNAPSRKVHRIILTARSDFFKREFCDPYADEIQCNLKLPVGAWQLDLILYFFYSGGIDLADKSLTSGRSTMSVSIELIRLGDLLESKSMQDYGKDVLASYLGELLDHICDTTVRPHEREDRFSAEKDFPASFCAAVRDAYDLVEWVEPVQDILADFASASRSHLFKNKEFVAFIKSSEIPEFGNLVLTAQMQGSVSDAFKDNKTFKKMQDWRAN